MRSNRWISSLLLACFAAICAPAGYGQSPDRVPTPSFGTSSRIQYHIGFGEFAPVSNTTPFGLAEIGSGYTYLGRISSAGFTTDFLAHPHIPTGARLASLELDFCDTAVTEHLKLDLFDCDFLGGGCTSIATITSVPPGDPGCGFITQDLTPLNYTMQNNLRSLVLRAEFGPAGITNVLLGAYMGYTLQVSPGPATATFSDVPTTSPLYKFVEALVAGGITAGCGSGNYCPTAPVTRGQMAVFLATALGLHFPD